MNKSRFFLMAFFSRVLSGNDRVHPKIDSGKLNLLGVNFFYLDFLVSDALKCATATY